MAVKLAHMGMYNGNPENVLDARVDMVMHAFHFSQFMQDYEDTSIELNKGNK